MADGPSYSYIITFRDDHRGRRENLLAVLAWLAPLEDVEILVVEQDARPWLQGGDLPAGATHLFAYNPATFNKSWGFNLGARQARGDVLALADGDILVDPAVILESFAACRGRVEALNPYSLLVDLDEAETRAFQGTGALLQPDQYQRRNRDYKGEYLCFCGGLYMIRRASYLSLGGQDERFSGWGGEDDAMSIKIRLLDRVAVNRSGVAYHLFHHAPPAESRTGSPEYRRNLALLREYASCSHAELLERCRADGSSLGDPDRYRD